MEGPHFMDERERHEAGVIPHDLELDAALAQAAFFRIKEVEDGAGDG